MFRKAIAKITTSAAVFLAVFGVGFALVPATVAAGPFDGARDAACQGVNFSAGATCSTANGESKVREALQLAITMLSFIAGFAAVVMIIIAGFRYITSGGDASKVSGSKDALLYAVIGLVIVAVAQVIVRFVLEKAN